MKKRVLTLSKIFTILLFLLLTISVSSSDAPFTKDRDHDGFPDDLETATGFNPDVNEPLKMSSREGKCGVIKTDLLKISRPHNVLLILDISGSMKSPLGGKPRIDIAKRVLNKYIDSLPRDMKIGFVIYGKSSCGDDSVELVAPIGRVSRSALKSRINSLTPKGLTPIAMTLNKSIEYFKGFEKDNNNLILISDGAESCGGNPFQAIRAIKESAINPEVVVIGLGVNRSTRQQLSKIAGLSGGVYADVKSEDDFVKAFASFFNKMNKFYKDIVCIVRQYNSYLTYETRQYNKSKSYLMLKKMTAKAELKNTLENVEKQIEENHSDRVKAKDKLNEMIKNKMEEMEEAIKNFVGTD